MTAVTDKLKEISVLFNTLSTGVEDRELMANYSQYLSTAFAELAELMKPNAGWAAATGASSRTTFDTTTVTTANLAARVKAIIDDLIARGELGP